MEVVDAKRAFLGWNEKNFNHFVSRFEPEQQAALKFIPVFLQINDRQLPGYNGPDTPAGIYGYLPASELINEVKQKYNKFNFNQTRSLKNAIIESIFLQQDVLSEKLTLWVVHIEKLKADQFDELENKIIRIQIWLKSRNLNIDRKLLTANRLSKRTRPAAVFLDKFYIESHLLAGKYPAWWLVPPEKEAQYDDFISHIKTARFVKEDEFIDIGGLSTLSQDDVMKLAVNHAQIIYKAPDVSFLELLLLKQQCNNGHEVDGLCIHLKNKIYSGNVKVEESFSENIILSLLKAEISTCKEVRLSVIKNPYYYAKLFGCLFVYSNTLSKRILSELSNQLDDVSRSIGVVEYIKFNKNLFSEIEFVFESILDLSLDGVKAPLQMNARNMLLYLKQGDDQVPVYITQSKAEFVLDRILIRHSIDSNQKDSWSLIVGIDENNEKIVNVFDSLVSLIAWGWLNRLVDRSTQISIQCPRMMVKQIEARHILDVLAQNINIDNITSISKRIFDRANHSVHSMVFFNSINNESVVDNIEKDVSAINLHNSNDRMSEVLFGCEQLIINSWGDVHAKRYQGADGVLQSLCDWTYFTPLSGRDIPKDLKFFGYGAGESTFLAQRIEKIYRELIQLFYLNKNLDACLIILMGNEFYFINASNDHLHAHRIGEKKFLYPFLERENTGFIQKILDKLALPDSPLFEILNRNKKDVIQIFFQIINRTCEAWILDEKGSMCHILKSSINRHAYISHWLYVMRNIKNRLKKINYQDKELPALEINEVIINRPGVIDFNSLGAEDIDLNIDFIDVQVVVTGSELGEKISLICDEIEFDADIYGDQVVSECVKFIINKNKNEGFRSVYVTNVEAPLRLYGVDDRENIQTVHFLKYMRNIESMLNRLID